MKRLCAVVALAALFQYHSAHAECRKFSPADEAVWRASPDTGGQYIDYNAQHVVSFGTGVVDVDATLGVGQSITTGASPGTVSTVILTCVNHVGTIQFALANGGAPGIQDAGVPGVGYKVSFVSSYSTTRELPYTINWAADTDQWPAIQAGSVFKIELIKTGPMQSVSTVNLGEVARIFGDDGVTALDVLANPVTLRVLPHCQVTSDKPLLVDFGQFGPRDVSTTAGPTQPVAITVACDGPTPPNTISATLAALPDPDDSDFIKNGGTATGLAIRLRDAATQALLKPQNVTSVLTKSAPGYGTTFDLEASVLRVGAATPAPGTIDAQAVVTLTFL